MNKNEIDEINKYCDSTSILIVTNKKRLFRLKCPFKVEVIYEVESFKIGEIKEVDAVKINIDTQLLYVINKRAYHYYFFGILYIEK